jgi:plasmid stabilization system protein ParE
MDSQVVILPDALTDLDEAAEFYEYQEAGLGQEVYAYLHEKLQSLKKKAGTHPKKDGVHRYVALGRFPYYSIYYRLKLSQATVIAIVDNRRDPEFNKQRLSAR